MLILLGRNAIYLRLLQYKYKMCIQSCHHPYPPSQASIDQRCGGSLVQSSGTHPILFLSLSKIIILSFIEIAVDTKTKCYYNTIKVIISTNKKRKISLLPPITLSSSSKPFTVLSSITKHIFPL